MNEDFDVGRFYTMSDNVQEVKQAMAVMQQSQKNFIDMTGQELDGLCKRIDAIICTIETVNGSVIKESRRIDGAERRVDQMFKDFGVFSDGTSQSIRRLNERIDNVNAGILDIMKQLKDTEHSNTLRISQIESSNEKKLVELELANEKRFNELSKDRVLILWFMGGLSAAVTLIMLWVGNQLLAGIIK